MNTMKFIGYYASFQGDRVIVNEDNSVIVFGKNMISSVIMKITLKKSLKFRLIKRYIFLKLLKIFMKAIHLHLMKFPTTDFIPLHN